MIHLGLIVGIRGRALSIADIYLGDIIVGIRVIQYDLGKIVRDRYIQQIVISRIP